MQMFSTSTHQYITGDIEPGKADIALDLRNLPLASGTFHLVLASHVLEHIVEDRMALNEIYRILHPGDVAVLIVPIVVEKTVEWGYQDPQRNGHVRDCGLDYFERYRDIGFDIEVFCTDDFDEPERYALASWRDGQRTIHWVVFCTKS